jgi:hypothetical protein
MRGNSTTNLERVAQEVLGKVPTVIGESEVGSWYYRSLKIGRQLNDIYVYDLDGVLVEVLHVEDFEPGNLAADSVSRLMDELDRIDEEALGEL